MKPLQGTELKRFLRRYRQAQPPQRTVAALLQSVEYPMNVGAAFRLADGVNLAELVLTGITPTPPQPTIDRVGRHKSRRVPWRYAEDAAVALAELKADGYTAVAVELTDDAVPYQDYDYPDKVCLVVGHEDHGVTRATLAACDATVFLPMYGKGRSLNVAMALAIVTYHVLYAPRPE